MKDFFNYFFGAAPEGVVEFKSFSLAHFLPILIMVGVILLIYLQRERIRAWNHETTIRYVLAFALIVCEMSYFWRLIGVTSLNPNPVDHLPITVCGWAVVFCSYMLVGKSKSLFDISYFWLFSGTVFALIMPTVITQTGPTRFRFYQFWLEHTLGYIAVFYMIFVHKFRPTIRSAVKSYIMLAILTGVAIFANGVIGPGANYLFMARPESTPSILDILPANYALRILIMGAVITVMFFLSYLPWLIMDRKAKKAERENTTEEAVQEPICK